MLTAREALERAIAAAQRAQQLNDEMGDSPVSRATLAQAWAAIADQLLNWRYAEELEARIRGGEGGDGGDREPA